MQYEVEAKFAVADRDEFERRMRGLDTPTSETCRQVDRYYAHPARDFASTDEALRIRRVGEFNCVTYKGPKIDRTTKTRQEIELPIASGERGASDFADLLEALGFRPVGEVRKRRQSTQLAWRDHEVEVAIDEVDGLGTFVELETSADETSLDQARDCIGSLAERLGLTQGERRSYLELLLDA